MRWTGLRRAAAWVAGLGCVVAASLPGTARGEVLVRYEFGGRFPTVTSANVSASPFTYEGDLTLGGLEPGVGNPPGSWFSITRYTTIGEAKQRDVAAFATLAPAAGQALNLQSFRVDLSAYSVTTNAYVGQLSVLSSLDNYTNPVYFNLAQDTGQNDGINGPWAVFESPGLATNPLYQNVTEPIEFRFYTFGSTLGSLYLDNVQITGTTTPVPEPAAAGLVALAAAFALRRRRA